LVIGTALAVGAFVVFGWRSGLTLTICSAVVIFSFLVFEKLTERLGNPGPPRSSRTAIPLLLVTAVAVILLIVVFRWKAFDPVAAAIGLSTVVLAIGAEVFRRGEGPAG
ncbi:MAG TPA: hypothetical protein VKJ00_03740, partial [Thermoanaerobaculia bacterium]|nr:hypothetical protein [Thermoanaerobaculia bacterium]